MNANMQAVYDFIKEYIEKNAFPPTQQEIADACLLAKSTVNYNLGKLEDAGLIYIEYGQWRGIRLTQRER